ncbi:uncharacterized protein LOC110012466 [Sesamum indicum]|uniref:Uncharacterized protein LOC110012466 n=1 Tax=Sesamum indicum TaxID=4182 RepID=A0A8M8V792_SESIN|nr:uncharacterized protein LOC110012466 [Sesamum indicum]
MERKRNVKNHGSHGQRRHRPLDAYELYELEHMPRTLQMKVPNIDRSKPREDETGRTVQNSWSQTKDGNHGHHGQRHRPHDAYELYELEHMPRTLHHAKVPSTDRARPGDQNGRESYKDNIDCEAEAFIRLEHEKFELSKWMSMNGC